MYLGRFLNAPTGPNYSRPSIFNLMVKMLLALLCLLTLTTPVARRWRPRLSASHLRRRPLAPSATHLLQNLPSPPLPTAGGAPRRHTLRWGIRTTMLLVPPARDVLPPHLASAAGAHSPIGLSLSATNGFVLSCCLDACAIATRSLE